MDAQVKALLVGLDLRYREADNGIGHTTDMKRQTRLTAAIERLEVNVSGLRPDTFSEMQLDGEEIVEWLHEHPKARVTVGYWCLDIESPEFADVDHERFDCPFDNCGGVEDFSKSQAAEGWHCAWSFG